MGLDVQDRRLEKPSPRIKRGRPDGSGRFSFFRGLLHKRDLNRLSDYFMSEVTCSKCGASRPPELAAKSERPTCPRCGETALTISVSIDESSMSLSGHAFAELVPGNQARDWKQRWKLVQEELRLVSSPHKEAMSTESIHASADRLFSFFIQTYHLKDALKDAAPGIGLKPSNVEDAITNDSRLALLADLANLDKHTKLTKRPRSGCAPVIKKTSGADSSTGNGWRLSVEIEHGASVLDGLSVAQDAVTAWQEKLKAWGFI